MLGEYEKISLKNISSKEVLGELGDEGVSEEVKKEFEEIIKDFKETLGDKVNEISLTGLMQTSAISLIKQNDNPMMAQLFTQMGQKMPTTKPDIELNVNHKIFQKLKNHKDKAKIAQVANLLFDSALIEQGENVVDSKEFTQNLSDVIIQWLE